jgi:GT2 family glycosyltransferase
MKPSQVSASVVVYRNDPQEVVSAVTSILSAPMRVTCTVIDNSPTQDLGNLVTECGAKYLYAGGNLGFGRGHNLALRTDLEASEYHLVLNPDVRFAQEVPVALYRFMNDNPEVGLVMPQIRYPDGTAQRLCKQFPTPLDLISRRFLGGMGRSLFANQLSRYELRHLDIGIAREIPCLSGCFMFIRSDALREVGPFDERYFMYMEDVDLCRRIGARYKTVFYPRVAVTHGYAKGSYNNLKLLKYHVGSAFRYFSKWGWIYDPERARLNSRTAPVPAPSSEGEGEGEKGD